MIVFDCLLRPYLYVMTNYERPYSYTQKEERWMSKLFTYCFLNKLTLHYSRTMTEFFTKQNSYVKFLHIFGYTTAWRKLPDMGGTDLINYMWTCIIGYNFGDWLEFAIYFVVLNTVAKTK